MPVDADVKAAAAIERRQRRASDAAALVLARESRLACIELRILHEIGRARRRVASTSW